jgi:hypothetical protein
LKTNHLATLAIRMKGFYIKKFLSFFLVGREFAASRRRPLDRRGPRGRRKHEGRRRRGRGRGGRHGLRQPHGLLRKLERVDGLNATVSFLRLKLATFSFCVSDSVTRIDSEKAAMTFQNWPNIKSFKIILFKNETKI